jgi:hypothetical protein
MMQPVTLVGVVVFLGALVLRYRTRPANARRSTRQQKFKTAKVLLSALLALMAIGYALQRFGQNLDGTAPEPTLVERIVEALAK